VADTDPLNDLADVIGRLRRECAWKAAQTHTSLLRFLQEETHELIEAVETGSTADVREELGDVLLQVFLHAAIADEAGAFTIRDVAADLIDKMVRRNPHVFGDLELDDPEAINEAWQAVKAEEKARTGLMEGVPDGLPALLYADKLIDRSTRAGRDLSRDADSEDIGERLLALVAQAHARGVDPEGALRAACRARISDA
jgi:XTP/dITP diphosphohydrolase